VSTDYRPNSPSFHPRLVQWWLYTYVSIANCNVSAYTFVVCKTKGYLLMALPDGVKRLTLCTFIYRHNTQRDGRTDRQTQKQMPNQYRALQWGAIKTVLKVSCRQTRQTYIHVLSVSVSLRLCLSVCLSVCLSLALRFNGHFPGEPGLAGVYWSKYKLRMIEVVVTPGLLEL